MRGNAKGTSILVLVLVFLSWQPDARSQQPSAPGTSDKPEDTRVGMTVDRAVVDAGDALDALEAPVLREPKSDLLETAADRVDFLSRNDPTHPLLPYLSGRLLAQAGRAREAVNELQRFVDSRRGRNEWKAYRLMGDLLVDQYPRLAKSNYDKAAELRPNEISIVFGQAKCASALGKNEDAIKMARRVVDEDGQKTAKYVTFLAQALFVDRQWEEAGVYAKTAVVLMQELIDRNPKSVKPYISLDGIYNLLIQAVRAEIATGEITGEEYVNLSSLMQEQIEVKLSISRFDIASTLERGINEIAEPPPELFLEYAILLTKISRWEETRHILEHVLEIDPGNETAMAWLEQVSEQLPDSASPSDSAENDHSGADDLESAVSENNLQPPG